MSRHKVYATNFERRLIECRELHVKMISRDNSGLTVDGCLVPRGGNVWRKAWRGFCMGNEDLEEQALCLEFLEEVDVRWGVTCEGDIPRIFRTHCHCGC